MEQVRTWQWHLRRWLPFAGAAAALALLFWTIAKYGAGATADSVAYISTARSLLDAQGFWRYDERYFLSWPPGMPVLIAALRAVTRLDLAKAAFLLNPVAYAGTVFVTARAFARRLQSPLLAVLGTVLVVASYPLLRTSSFLWSEPLFNFAVAVILALILEQPDRPRGRRWQVGLLAVAFATAALTRYIGFVVYVPIALWLLFDQTVLWRERLWRAISVGAPAGILMGAWLLRNYWLSQTFAGPRRPTTLTWHDNLYRLYVAVESWLTAKPWLKPPQYSSILIGVGAALLLFAWFQREWARVAMPAIAVVVAYSAFLIYSTSRVALDPVDSRLASPLYVPLVMIVVLTADYVLRARWRPVGWVFLVVPLLFGCYGVRRTVELVEDSRREGVGGFYREQLAPLAATLGETLQTGTFYSNSADAFYYMTLQTRARWVPTPEELPTWAGQLPADHPVYVVWFKGGWGSMATPDEMRQVANVALFRDVQFAQVFAVTRK